MNLRRIDFDKTGEASSFRGGGTRKDTFICRSIRTDSNAPARDEARVVEICEYDIVMRRPSFEWEPDPAEACGNGTRS